MQYRTRGRVALVASTCLTIVSRPAVKAEDPGPRVSGTRKWRGQLDRGDRWLLRACPVDRGVSD